MSREVNVQGVNVQGVNVQGVNVQLIDHSYFNKFCKF